VAVTDRGFINVDIQMRTNVPHIFAIGDIVGQPIQAGISNEKPELATVRAFCRVGGDMCRRGAGFTGQAVTIVGFPKANSP
jgi:dihydrolipoamide dehydrogenase